MLVAVKAPHIDLELICRGQGTGEFIELIRKHYRVKVFTDIVVSESGDDELIKTVDSSDEELIDINETDWWKNNKHRVLAGARLKAGLTQKQLAASVGIRQTVLSEYENGKRKITPKMAEKFAVALHTRPEKFLRRDLKQTDETEYLLRSPKNAGRLKKAIKSTRSK